MSTVIEADSVSKKYKLQFNRPLTLKESIIRLAKRRLESAATIWALKDVTFSVEQGMALGIVGHNGAGKSTLLRLLCGIGRPTRGEINRVGKVSGLLELGSGFHPDLTGRENIMTGGLLNGLTVEDIKGQESEIISFAELEQFIDQPIRTYSSGMYLRLAFSTAMHFDPDVLIIDEVLAVGDTNFQKKCFEKLLSFRKSGKTLILTSHIPDQIQKICDDVLVLEEGVLVMQGEPEKAIPFYNDLMRQRSERRSEQIHEEGKHPLLKAEKGIRLGTQEAIISSLKTCDSQGHYTNRFRNDDNLTIEIKYERMERIDDMALIVGIYSDIHVKCFEMHFPSLVEAFGPLSEHTTLCCHIPKVPLLNGRYFVNLGLYPTNWDYVYDYHWQMHPIYIGNRDGIDTSRITGVLSVIPEWFVKNSR
jgi:lipopolysaccharide transport system ATP-binding protein